MPVSFTVKARPAAAGLFVRDLCQSPVDGAGQLCHPGFLDFADHSLGPGGGDDFDLGQPDASSAKAEWTQEKRKQTFPEWKLERPAGGSEGNGAAMRLAKFVIGPLKVSYWEHAQWLDR